MVLTGPASPRNRGVTLLELLVALSLGALVVAMALALYRGVAGAARITGGRARGEFAAETFFTAFTHNLMVGRGILRLAPDAVVLLNERGGRVEYRWADSSLTVNGKAQSFRLSALALDVQGPQIPLGDDGLPDWNLAPALDTLDGNRDGNIDFSELDRDHSGELDVQECRYLSLVRVTLTTALGDIATTRSMVVHPRNHARDSVATESDVSEPNDPLE